MRGFIFVSAERTDLDQYAEQVELVRNAFDRYLDAYRMKTGRTKTGLMGPVGKVLSEARSGKWDAESLTGFALNIHLMNPGSHGYIDANARAALHEGVRALMALLAAVPAAAQDKLLDRIDYGLYWARRRKAMERLEQIRADFADYLRKRYIEVSALNQAWGLRGRAQLDDFAHAPYPSRRSKRYKGASATEQVDVDTFWQLGGEEPAEAEEGDES